ncbi:hypothetical protein, partial, partial [Absidia glauca]
RTIPLAAKHISRINELLVLSNPRKVLSDILHELVAAPACYRRPHYEDIRNINVKRSGTTYRKDNDDNVSFDKWLSDLEEEGYLIFVGDLQAYRARSDRFAKGFLSPTQLAQMQTAVAFSLDATHGLVKDKSVIMYTLVVAHSNTGQGFPVGYMITNDHTVGPLAQWLRFLKANGGMTPIQITIDCSIPEVNAILATFDNVTIRFCLFHVMQAIKRQIDRKVVLANGTGEEQANYRGQMMTDLRILINVDTIPEFENAYQDFKVNYHDQVEFLRYLEDKWMAPEKVVMWSDAYRTSVEHDYMRTNNFVESWHNQLKSFFLDRRPNKRLDNLVYVLVRDVAFYHRSQFERISRMIGRMGPIHHENSIRGYRADKISDDELTRRVALQLEGVYTVLSSANEGASYDVAIIDNLIKKCTCIDYERRKRPCKHMYMVERHLKRTIKVFMPAALTSQINAYIDAQIPDSSDEEGEEIRRPRETSDAGSIAAEGDFAGRSSTIDHDSEETDTQVFLQQQNQFFTTMYHERESLGRLTSMSAEDAQRGSDLLDQLARYYEEIVGEIGWDFKLGRSLARQFQLRAH